MRRKKSSIDCSKSEPSPSSAEDGKDSSYVSSVLGTELGDAKSSIVAESTLSCESEVSTGARLSAAGDGGETSPSASYPIPSVRFNGKIANGEYCSHA